MSNQRSQKWRRAACVAGIALLATCRAGFAAGNTSVNTAVSDDNEAPIQDPFETFNRHTFAFNDALDTNLLQPAARIYNKIIPKPLNQGIHNFFLNLNTVPTIVDDFLQFNFYQMTNDAWRLVINTTVGIGGLFDVASRMNLKYYENDFGMTLATWGYRKSNYLVLPFYGSYTVRDAMSLPVDYFGFSVYPYIEPQMLRLGLYAVGVVDWRAQTLKYNDLMDAAALDKYVFVRNAYMQRRSYQLEENRHLGVYDRQTAVAISEDSPGIRGAAANIDESANIGKPANIAEPSVTSGSSPDKSATAAAVSN